MPTEQIPHHVRHAATLLVDDEAFKAACLRLQETYFLKWRNAETPEARERLWIAASQVQDIQTELVYLRDHNKIDDARIAKMANRSAR